MEVYVVIEGLDHEGEKIIAVFLSVDMAIAFAKRQPVCGNPDYYVQVDGAKWEERRFHESDEYIAEFRYRERYIEVNKYKVRLSL